MVFERIRASARLPDRRPCGDGSDDPGVTNPAHDGVLRHQRGGKGPALARSDGDFLDVFGSLLCDSDPQKAKDILGQMTNSLKNLPPNLRENAVDCISQAFSRTLSKREMLLIAAGESVEDNVYNRVSRSLTLACPEYEKYFPDGQALRDLCDNFASFLPKEQF